MLFASQVEELEARIAELQEASASSSTAAEEAAAEREQLQQQVRQQASCTLQPVQHTDASSISLSTAPDRHANCVHVVMPLPTATAEPCILAALIHRSASFRLKWSSCRAGLRRVQQRSPLPAAGSRSWRARWGLALSVHTHVSGKQTSVRHGACLSSEAHISRALHTCTALHGDMHAGEGAYHLRQSPRYEMCHAVLPCSWRRSGPSWSRCGPLLRGPLRLQRCSRRRSSCCRRCGAGAAGPVLGRRHAVAV